LLVLVMVGSGTAMATTTTRNTFKDLRIVTDKSIEIYKTKVGIPYTFKIKSLWRPMSKTSAISKVIDYTLKEISRNTYLNNIEKQKLSKEIKSYLNVKLRDLNNIALVKVDWNNPENSESIAIVNLSTGKVIFDLHMWFYAAGFVERHSVERDSSIHLSAVHWSDYKNFHRVFDIYNIFGIKIATWTFDTTIITEISPSSSISLSGTGYVDSSVYFNIQTEGFTLNHPAILFGDGATSGNVIYTYNYITKVKITTPNQDTTQISKYDHFGAGTGSSIKANNGKGSATVSLGINLGPFSISVTPNNKFIKAEPGDTYGRYIKIVNVFRPDGQIDSGGNDGIYFNNGYIQFSLKFRVGDDTTPNTGTVDVHYKINYVALAGIEFYTIASPDTYTAHLEFSRR